MPSTDFAPTVAAMALLAKTSCFSLGPASKASEPIAFKQEFIKESLEFHKSRTLRSQIYHENDYDADDSFVDNG